MSKGLKRVASTIVRASNDSAFDGLCSRFLGVDIRAASSVSAVCRAPVTHPIDSVGVEVRRAFALPRHLGRCRSARRRVSPSGPLNGATPHRSTSFGHVGVMRRHVFRSEGIAILLDADWPACRPCRSLLAARLSSRSRRVCSRPRNAGSERLASSVALALRTMTQMAVPTRMPSRLYSVEKTDGSGLPSGVSLPVSRLSPFMQSNHSLSNSARNR